MEMDASVLSSGRGGERRSRGTVGSAAQNSGDCNAKKTSNLNEEPQGQQGREREGVISGDI